MAATTSPNLKSVFYGLIFIIAAILTAKLLRYLIICFFRSDYYKRVFADRQKRWGAYYNNRTTRTVQFRLELLAQINEKLKELGGDLVELGPGAGRNTRLMKLPEGCSLIVVDYNPEMERPFRENLKTLNPDLHLKEFIVQSAEDMSQIADESVSAVLATQLLCSLDQDAVQRVLKEIQRILKPGGYYFFLEHVIDKPGTIRRFLQILASSITGIWPLFTDGCCADKDTGGAIQRAGFGTVSFKRAFGEVLLTWREPMFIVGLYLARPRIWGYAIKKKSYKNTASPEQAK